MKKSFLMIIAGLFLIGGASYAFESFNHNEVTSETTLTVPDKDPKADCCKTSAKDKDKKACADSKTAKKDGKSCATPCSSEKKAENCDKSKGTSTSSDGTTTSEVRSTGCPKTKCQ